MQMCVIHFMKISRISRRYNLALQAIDAEHIIALVNSYICYILEHFELLSRMHHIDIS